MKGSVSNKNLFCHAWIGAKTRARGVKIRQENFKPRTKRAAPILDQARGLKSASPSTSHSGTQRLWVTARQAEHPAGLKLQKLIVCGSQALRRLKCNGSNERKYTNKQDTEFVSDGGISSGLCGRVLNEGGRFAFCAAQNLGEMWNIEGLPSWFALARIQTEILYAYPVHYHARSVAAIGKA